MEYLTWAFANQKRDAAAWLNSAQEERRRMFTPSRLRSESDGRFLSTDYGHHCEQGGHPVPRAIPLLGSTDPFHSQMLLVDLLLHSWRTTDNIAIWARDRAVDPLLTELRQVQEDFAEWGRGDLLYAWTCKQGGQSARGIVDLNSRAAEDPLTRIWRLAGCSGAGDCRCARYWASFRCQTPKRFPRGSARWANSIMPLSITGTTTVAPSCCALSIAACTSSTWT